MTAIGVRTEGIRSPRRHSVSRLTLFVPRQITWHAALIGIGTGAAYFYTVPQDSAMVALGIGFCAYLLWHTLAASRSVLWIPGFMLSVAAIQWVIAPVMLLHSDSADPLLTLAARPADYFGYVVACLIAMSIGVALPLRSVSRVQLPHIPARIPKSFVSTCERMFWMGLVARAVVFVAPESLRFVVVLVYQLAFVAAFGLALARTPWWWVRVALILICEFAFDSRDGMFLQVVVWSMMTAGLIAFRYRIRVRRMMPVLALGAMVVTAMNTFKATYRNAIRNEQLTDQERAQATSQHLADLVLKPSQLFSARAVDVNLQRLNQGYIISRVLTWVPGSEPFARGETILTALQASVVPRFLAPNKYVAGGVETVTRFSGIELLNGTSMNLAIPGDMYANFGTFGGIVAVLCYGVFIGLLFRLFVYLGRTSPLWWAWAPYVLLAVVSAEDGFGETINRITKTLMVLIVAALALPAWRALLPARRPVRNDS